MRKEIAFLPKTRKNQMIKRQSERKPWNGCPRKKAQTNLLEEAPKRAEEAGGCAVGFLKEKAQSEYSIRQQELELQKKEQEARARQQELHIERLRTEQQVQILQALMTMMQNLVKK